MSQKNPTDWVARCTAIAGVLLGVAGFVLAYYSYRWQKIIYEESTAERILVRLNVSRNAGPTGYLPGGRVGVVVTNIGLRSIYLKRVSMTVGHTDLPTNFVVRPGSPVSFEIHQVAMTVNFYDAGRLNATESLKVLQPSESVNYTKDWDFSNHPLHRWEKTDTKEKEEELTLEVETTKKLFSYPHESPSIEEIRWIPPGASTP